MTRRWQQIVDLLAGHPEGLKSQQIADALGISKQAASTHACKARDAGLLTFERIWHDEPWHHHRFYVWKLRAQQVAA